MNSQDVDPSRRSFLVKAAYTAPLIVTLSVMPRIASAGSTNGFPGGELSPTSNPATSGSSNRHHHHNHWHWT